MPLPYPQPRGLRTVTGALQTPVAVGEQGVAIGVVEVGRPEGAKIGGELGHQ